ncbi:cation/multidrug efflux pump [gamma proteobacterium HTCC5015]|nr:cation/multidrug efflux pump [gamma proteobacterium HTCC5015]
MSQTIYILAGLVAFLGLILIWRGLSNVLTSDLHKFRGLIQCIVSIVFFVFAGVVVVASFNLSAYKHLLMEETVATLSFEPLHEPQRYIAHLKVPGEPTRRFEVRGDQWQIEARILKWDDRAAALGLTPMYQLERLNGRYNSVSDERDRQRSVNDLHREKGLVDLWSLAQEYPQYLPFIDAQYGSATFLPMIEGARYDVRLTRTGLIARIVVE